MYKPLTLVVDILLPSAIGGITTNPAKIDHNLNLLEIDKKKLIEHSKGIPLPTVIFPAGAYVVILQFVGNLEKPQMSFVNFDVSIEDNFDVFADSMSPKSIPAFHTAQQKIIERGAAYQTSVTLTDQFRTS